VKEVAIVEYGAGNLDSVTRAVEECGGAPIVTHDPQAFKSAGAIILPGVGAFGEGMRSLRELRLVEVLTEQVVERKVPFLGICLGMQLMATAGYEGGNKTDGLGWIDGEVRKLEPVAGERIPHVGWNDVSYTKNCALFKRLPDNNNFYFVHSFHFVPFSDSEVAARTPFCGRFVSAIEKDNMFGVQFHPEKSQRAGFALLRNFLSL
jgi:glutamine amidotransferase